MARRWAVVSLHAGALHAVWRQALASPSRTRHTSVEMNRWRSAIMRLLSQDAITLEEAVSRGSLGFPVLLPFSSVR